MTEREKRLERLLDQAADCLEWLRDSFPDFFHGSAVRSQLITQARAALAEPAAETERCGDTVKNVGGSIALTCDREKGHPGSHHDSARVSFDQAAGATERRYTLAQFKSAFDAEEPYVTQLASWLFIREHLEKLP